MQPALRRRSPKSRRHSAARRRFRPLLEQLEARRLLTASLSISDALVDEGNSGLAVATFTVSLSEPAPASGASVLWSAVPGGTAAASDLQAMQDQPLSFNAGETSQTISVNVVGDTLMERDETFQVILSAPTNAVLYDNLGQGTIVDEDIEAIYTTPTLDGFLDETWDGDGIKNFNRPVSDMDAAAGTAIDPDGRVLVFGNYPGVRSSEAFAVRFFHNGIPDPSFGIAGIATLPRPNNFGVLQVFGGAVYASGANRGKVLVHAAYGASNDDILVARFNVDGSLDATFGSGQGYLQLDSGSIRDWSQDIAIYESGPQAGKFIVVGASDVASVAATGLIARYDANGTLDPTFGSGGWLAYRQTYTDAAAAIKPNDSTDFDRVLFDSAGRLVISGTTGRPGTYSAPHDTRTPSTAALWRFDDAGNLDASFGTGGVAYTPLDSYGGTFNDVAIQADGKIVQQVEQVNLNPGLSLARFTPDGQLDLTFGDNGDGTVTSNSFGPAKTLSLDAADRILVGGETGPVGLGHFFVARYSADGVLDNIFDPVQHDGGISPYLDPYGYRYNLHGAVLNSEGNLLLAGHRSPPYSDLGPAEMATARYETARGDLSVTMTGPTTEVCADSTISYTITVRNTGDDAVFASLRDILPYGMTFVSLTTPSGWAYAAPAVGSTGTVVAATRKLRASDGDQVFTLTVVVGPLSGDINTVTVSSATLDYNEPNNTASFTIIPACIAPVSWWKAEEDATDSIDGNHGAPAGSVAYADGMVGQAFSFDGGSYVSVPDAANLDFTNTLTIEGWVNLSTNNFNNGLVFKGDLLTPSQGAYSLGFYTGGSNQLTFRLNQNSVQVVGATLLQVGEWYHIAAVYDQVSARIYVNGVEDGSTTYTAAIGTNNAPLIIGGYFTPGYLFRGLIDEASVYDRALTAQNVESIYAAGIAGSDGKCLHEVVADDDDATVAEDSADNFIDVLANDSVEPEGSTLMVTAVTQGAHGAVTYTGAGVSYTPNADYFGPDTFTYTISDGQGGSCTAEVTVTVNSRPDVDFAGRVFDDLDNDGLFNGSDAGIGGVSVQLFTESNLATPLATVDTASDGTYLFDLDLGAGSYRIVADQAAGLLDGKETAGSLGGIVNNTVDSNATQGIVVTTAAGDLLGEGYNFAELRPSRVQGLVWEDANNNGEVDSGERAIADVSIRLTGTDDRGAVVDQLMQTDSQGLFEFLDLRPSDADGYTLTETQPTAFLDGLDVLGTVNGLTTGSSAVNDVFSQIGMTQPGSDGINYNFAELPSSAGHLQEGQTATIGYWQNNNGQALIKSLNGGSSQTQLANWLATSFPNLYGADAGVNNLSGKTNSQVAAFYTTLFMRTKKTAAGSGPPKVDAQILAVALAAYVTNENLAGSAAEDYGFTVDAYGTGAATFNVGNNGAAFGVANGSEVRILDLLLAVNSRSTNGLLYDLNGNGRTTDANEELYRTMANNVFSGINEFGDI